MKFRCSVMVLALFALAPIASAGADNLSKAATALPPVPIHPESWLTAKDYPPDAIRQRQQGKVRVEIDVDTAGNVYRCTVLRTSGARSLDDAACRGFLERARFVAARDQQGLAIPSGYVVNFTWELPADARAGPLSSTAPVDAIFEVVELPSGLKWPKVTIWEIQGADGVIESCGIVTSSGSAGLDAAACKAAQSAAFEPLKDQKDSLVRALRMQTIGFVIPNSGPSSN